MDSSGLFRGNRMYTSGSYRLLAVRFGGRFLAAFGHHHCHLSGFLICAFLAMRSRDSGKSSHTRFFNITLEGHVRSILTWIFSLFGARNQVW